MSLSNNLARGGIQESLVDQKSFGGLEGLDEVVLVDIKVKEGMGCAVEGDEACDVALAADALGEFFNTRDWNDRVFIAVEKEHGGELSSDVFTRAGAACVAL